MKQQKPNKEIKELFLNIRMPASVMEELRIQAEANTRTISGQALLYIKQGLAQKS